MPLLVLAVISQADYVDDDRVSPPAAYYGGPWDRDETELNISELFYGTM